MYLNVFAEPGGRGQLKCAGTRAETRLRLSAKRTSPFKPAGTSVQSTTGSRGVRISGSNAGYTMFQGSVKSTVYPLHSPVSPSVPSRASPCAVTFQLESNISFSFSHQRLVTKSDLHSPCLSTETSNIPQLNQLRHVHHSHKFSLFDDTKYIC